MKEAAVTRATKESSITVQKTATPVDLQPALDAVVASYISPVSIGLAILYAILATVYYTLLPPPINVGAGVAHMAAAILLVGLHAAIRRRQVPGDWAHLIGTGVAVLAMAVSAALILLTGNAVHSTSFTLIVIGVGVFFLSWRWLALAVAAADLVWFSVSTIGPASPYWTQLGLTLFSANVLAFLVHLVRMRTIGGLERLRVVETRQRRELERQTERLEEAQATGHIGSWEWDIASNRVAWSAELYKLFGLEPASAEITYEKWLDMVHPDDREMADAIVKRAYADGTPYEFDHRVKRPDGTIHWLHGKGRVALDSTGRPVKMIGTAQDITTRKHAEAEIHSLNADLERRVAERTAELAQANKELEAFSYSVSHDLRAPLMTVDGFSQALLEQHSGKLDPEARRMLERVRNATQRMGELIEAILKLSRLGRSQMRVQKTNLSVIAETFAEELHKAHPTRRVDVKVQPAVFATGDPPLLRVVIENLIGNAWKFTSKNPTGYVEFGATRRGGEDVYYVRDDGAGFDPEFVAKLFLPFERLHTANDFPGTGIGLASVKRVIDRHGGRVWADGYPGKGAAFYFTIGPEAAKATATVAWGLAAKVAKP